MSCAAPTVDAQASPSPVVGAAWDQAPATPFPQLPSFETATQTTDASKLPSYSQSRSTSRFHPYTRWIPALVDGTGLDRLMNTVFDEERIDVVPPPALLHGPRPVPALVAGAMPERRATPAPFARMPAANALDYELAQPDVVEFERRAQAVAGVILQEFVAGLRRAQQA
ncbi:hypothetical protein HYPSUDRAFT_196756 [Hypholoma sublateritium FD-334 SS-4]|uniref:Uncharacterized protein n=1 Tax=Hypholoma sublateritium (strain FD-334 SS-4) TaxID=945553 RepID=A0A0D2PM34_HYPSF|nr:hypothetical protein HYPSUDRAFT_196756 [Hypholoma sublateritium FD-334 SS-4]